MTPIKRVQRRAEAAARLNVSIHISASELEDVWRERAKEVHPDRSGGDDREFRRLERAYQILAENARDDGKPRRSREGGRGTSITPRRVLSRTLTRPQRMA